MDLTANAERASPGAAVHERIIVIGRNSTVWKWMSPLLPSGGFEVLTLSHRDVDGFAFRSLDLVWVFSYSRQIGANIQLVDAIAASGVAELIYVSSSSTVVAERTNCYEYPRVKLAAERRTLGYPVGRVVTLGQVYRDVGDLPSGTTAATSVKELLDFFVDTQRGNVHDRVTRLFTLVSRPFNSKSEQWLYQAYTRCLLAAEKWPCLLRPIDALLRMAGIRWYGYVRLSSALWTMKT